MATALAETIAAQPEALGRILELDLTEPLERLDGAERIWLVGTGTSQHASELGTLMLRDAGRQAQWQSSAAFVRSAPMLGPGDAVVVISHTTETAFARTARRRASEAGARLVSITGVGRDWPEAIATVPAERSETYTASYTAALFVLARLSVELGADGFSAGEVAAIPGRVRSSIRRAEHAELAVPERVLVIAGAGPAAVTAREGALKLREAARVLSEGYEAEYLLHGGAVPLTADDGLLLLAPGHDPDGLLPRLGAAAEQAGLAVSELDEPASGCPLLDQIPLTAQLQVLAARAAETRGQNPDVVIVGRRHAAEGKRPAGLARTALQRLGQLGDRETPGLSGLDLRR
jgi:glucosamine--fructose-6-phosphate aminotransferase (isomerizing)